MIQPADPGDVPRPPGEAAELEAALIDAARQAQARAYAPYSNFRVGAALRAADGRVFSGCNVENASYPVGMCAERVALGAAVAAGALEFAALAVVGEGPDPSTPCGMCRQALVEFAPELEVLCAGTGARVDGYRLVPDLLPAAFGPGDLG